MPLTPPPFWNARVADFVNRAEQLLAVWPEAILTSWYRTPQRNREVGGAAKSQHLEGTGLDCVLPRRLVAWFMEDARTVGLQPLDEGDHVHLQFRR